MGAIVPGQGRVWLNVGGGTQVIVPTTLKFENWKNEQMGPIGELASARRARFRAKPRELATLHVVRCIEATRAPKISARACLARDEIRSTSAG